MASSFSQKESDPFHSQWTRDNYQTSNLMSSNHLGSIDSKVTKGRKNLQHYTFGGMTSIRKTPLYGQLRPNQLMTQSDHNMSSDLGFESGREKLTGFSVSKVGNEGEFIQLQRPQRPKVPNFFEQAYGADAKKKARERPLSCKSGYSRKSNILERIKTYKAPNPYKNTKASFYKKDSRKGSKRFK